MARLPALLLALSLAAGACSSDGDDPTVDDTATTTTAEDTSSAGAELDLTGDEAEVEAAWEAFFDLDNTFEEAAALLEGGESMREAIEAGQSQETRVTADVYEVRIVGDLAAVRYRINAEDGTVLLPEASGVAVRADGEWKLSDGTYCTLITQVADVPSCEGKIEPDVPPAA